MKQEAPPRTVLPRSRVQDEYGDRDTEFALTGSSRASRMSLGDLKIGAP